MNVARIPAAIGWCLVAVIGIAITVALLPLFGIIDLLTGGEP